MQSKPMDELVSYLKTTLRDMITDQVIFQSPNIKVDKEQFIENCVQILKQSVRSDREKYLYQLIEKLGRINAEHQEIEDKYEKAKIQGDSTTKSCKRKNEELKNTLESLESQLKSLEFRSARKEKAYKEKIEEKNQMASKMNSIVNSIQTSTNDLYKQLSSLRNSALKMKTGPSRLIARAKTYCLSQVEEAIEKTESDLQDRKTNQLAKITTTIAMESSEQKSLERKCQSMLDAVWAIKPDADHPNVSPHDFPKRFNEVRDFIDSSLESRKEHAVEDLKQELQQVIPGIRFDSVDVHAAILKRMKEEIKIKENQCQSILNKGEAREKRLRQKLDEALNKIQRLQSVNTNEVVDLEEFERSKNSWEEQKKRLDQTMQSLSFGPDNLSDD